MVGWRGEWFVRVGGTNQSPTLVKADPPRVGAILRVAVKGVNHEGVWTGDDVIHSSARRGRVARESLAMFGGPRRLVYVVGQGAPGTVERAAAKVGEPWSVVRNCQRFVSEVSRKPRVSSEATTIVAGAALLAFRLAG